MSSLPPSKTDEGGVPVEVQGMPFADQQSQLFDLKTDPRQTTQLNDPEKVAQMCQLIIDNMVKLDAPAEAYNRFGFVRPDNGVKWVISQILLLMMADQLVFMRDSKTL